MFNALTRRNFLQSSALSGVALAFGRTPLFGTEAPQRPPEYGIRVKYQTPDGVMRTETFAPGAAMHNDRNEPNVYRITDRNGEHVIVADWICGIELRNGSIGWSNSITIRNPVDLWFPRISKTGVLQITHA